MKKRNYILLIILIIVLGACGSYQNNTSVAHVELKQNDKGHYRFFVDGEEFYVKGAGSQINTISFIGEHGGNSLRTWHTGERAVDVLDSAYKYGLKVLMGIYIVPERHGFDYNDSIKVKEQFDFAKEEVERLKDHPALLGWIIGNELNLRAENLKVYDAVNQISVMIHEVDGNHPTTTTLAGINKREVDYIKKNCTDIDFLSLQLYGAIVNLQRYIDESGLEGPYIVTEWGATGHWEVTRTEWNVAIEQSSQEKAHSFIDRYKIAIESDPEYCIGSYVFLWGQKQERTPTWYGMFLENGNKTETVDAMHYIWNGEWPENRCPTLDSFKINSLTAYDNIKLKAKDNFVAEVFAKDFENDSLGYSWEIIPESTDLSLGGDFEKRPESLTNSEGHSTIELMVPEIPGAYRLFVYVTDPENKTATANIPFFVDE